MVENIVDVLDGLSQFISNEKYMEGVLGQYPNWYPQVVHLHQEYQLLNHQIKEICERTNNQIGSNTVSREMRQQLKDWIESYNTHEKRKKV